MVSENKNSGQDERQRAELQCEEQASRGQGGVSGLRTLFGKAYTPHLVAALYCSWNFVFHVEVGNF